MRPAAANPPPRGTAGRDAQTIRTAQARESPQKGFTEPGALSSTVPADLPTQALRPHRPIAGSCFDLLASRARCTRHPTRNGARNKGRLRPKSAKSAEFVSRAGSIGRTIDVDLTIVIVSLHVATGAALGALTGSRLAALVLGPPLHLACDYVPHEDIADRRFEIRSGLFALALLALSRGPLDPATLGGCSASAPDLEHVFRRLRPHGRKLFHGRLGWHRSGRFSANAQLVLAGVILGLLLTPRSVGREMSRGRVVASS